MASFTAEGPGGYQVACQLIDELKAANIECGVTMGGISLSLTGPEIQKAQRICEKHGWRIQGGSTYAMSLAVENMSIANGDTDWIDQAQRRVDSQAVVDEWVMDR